MAVSHENLPGAAKVAVAAVAANAANAQRAADSNVRELPVPGPLDVTLPPTPIRELLAASGATLFVLATDANFITTVRRAAEQHPLFFVESWPELLEAVESGKCGIALLDAAQLGSRVSDCIATLYAHRDRLVTLVAAERAAAHEFVGLLSGGRIHRLLIKPTAIGAARLLIESATARRLQLRDESAKDVAPPAVAPTRFQTWGWATAAGLGAIALLAVGLVGGGLDWWNRAVTTESAAAAAAPAPATPANAPTSAELVADHRAKAALAFEQGRLAEPLGDSALDHHLAILAIVPSDQAARDGVSSVVNELFTRAEGALLANSLQAAAATLDQVRRAVPTSSRLAFLDAQLSRALAVLPVPPPTVVESGPPPAVTGPTELESILSLASARLARGQLVTPVGDSAVAYLDRAVQVGRSDPRVATLRADVSAALIVAGRLALETDLAMAANLTAEARRLGLESPRLVALEADVSTAAASERQRQLLERFNTARARVQSGALFAPAGDSALDYLTRLQSDAPEFAGLAEQWEAFRQAAVLAIESSINRGDWATADTQLAGLAKIELQLTVEGSIDGIRPGEGLGKSLFE